MGTEYEVAVPDATAAFADACNSAQMTPEQIQQVVVSPTANFNTAVGQGYNPQLPEANINAAPGQPHRTGIQTDHSLQYGLENVAYNLQEVQTVGLLGDCMGAMGKLCQDVRDGPQLPQPANQTREPAQEVDAVQPAPENTIHTQRAQLELNQFSPAGPGGMAA